MVFFLMNLWLVSIATKRHCGLLLNQNKLSQLYGLKKCLFEQKLGAVLQKNKRLWIPIIWGSTKFGCNERRFGVSLQIITDLGSNFAAAPRYLQGWEDFKSQHRCTMHKNHHASKLMENSWRGS